jgi:UDP-N-acetyl-D-mannosaminuronic acid dehydrogenase
VDKIEDALKDKDGIIILAKQSEFDNITIEYLINILHSGTIVFDTKNLFRKFSSDLISKGIQYKAI